MLIFLCIIFVNKGPFECSECIFCRRVAWPSFIQRICCSFLMVLWVGGIGGPTPFGQTCIWHVLCGFYMAWLFSHYLFINLPLKPLPMYVWVPFLEWGENSWQMRRIAQFFCFENAHAIFNLKVTYTYWIDFSQMGTFAQCLIGQLFAGQLLNRLGLLHPNWLSGPHTHTSNLSTLVKI